MSQENQPDPTVNVTPAQEQATEIEKAEAAKSKSAIITTEKEEEELSPTNRPTSPSRSGGQRSQILSPKSSGSRRPQSPGVFKGKLQIVRNFLIKEEQKLANIEAESNPLVEEKEALQRQWNQKQEQLQKATANEQNTEHLEKEIDELKKNNDELYLKIQSLKKVNEQKRLTQKQLLSNKIEAVKAEILRKQKEDSEKQSSVSNQAAQIKEQALKVIQEVKAKEADIKKKQSENSQLNEANARLVQERDNLKRDLDQASEVEKIQKRQQDKRKADLQAKIKEARDRISLRKKQIADTKAKEGPASNQGNESAALLKEAKNKQKNINDAIKKVEKEVAARRKEASQAADDQKKKDQKVKELSKKIEQLQKTKQEIQEDIKKVETHDDKPRFEEKIPEELIAIKQKNNTLRQDLKKISDKIDAEKAEMDRLVPPAVIESMNKKISTSIANNERLGEVSKIIEEITAENVKLAEEREGLEWGENDYLNELNNERKKQVEKNKSLEEELQTKNKSIQQLNGKLEEYVVAYPEFKPKKKPEPKKEVKKTASLVPAEGDRSPTDVKKKKNANDDAKKGGKKKKSEVDEVKEEKVQEPVAVKVQPKKEETKKKRKR